MSWYKEDKDAWREIIETVAAEEQRMTQMVEKDTIPYKSGGYPVQAQLQ